MNKKVSHIILYDGYCELCARSIRFIVKNETLCSFTYIPLQSEEGKGILKQHKIEHVSDNTFVYIENDKAFLKSTAALMVCKQIKKLRWMRIFIYVPQLIRDLIYSFIAKYRYKLFGKNDDCFIP